MKKIFNLILIIAICFASIGVIENYVPMKYLDWRSHPQLLGTSVTTINGTDQISASRTIINTNFSNLNAGKIEISTTSLPLITSLANLATVGTISSGIWNGTVIGSLYGGTGSTTLSQYSLLLGSTTNAVGIVSGLGSSGQVLSSNGSGQPPSWTNSISASANNTFTGLNTFSATSSFATTTQFSVLGGLSPTGSIIAYASTTPPSGWLLADGSSLVRSAYPELYQVIGTSYGSADATHFTLPNLQNRQITMASTTANIGQTGGEQNHTLTTAELAAHSHVLNGFAGGGGSSLALNLSSSAQAGATANSGGDQAHNVLDPYIVLQYIIKY